MEIKVDRNKLYPLWSQDFGGEKYMTTYEAPLNAKWYYSVMRGSILETKYKDHGIGNNEIDKIFDDYQEAVIHLDNLKSWKYYISAGLIKDEKI